VDRALRGTISHGDLSRTPFESLLMKVALSLLSSTDKRTSALVHALWRYIYCSTVSVDEFGRESSEVVKDNVAASCLIPGSKTRQTSLN